jgi:hypothetical protein
MRAPQTQDGGAATATPPYQICLTRQTTLTASA